MTSFSTRLPNEDNAGITNQDAESDNSLKSPSGKLAVIKELFNYQTRINSLTRFLLRIIALIVVAAAAVGIYELMG